MKFIHSKFTQAVLCGLSMTASFSSASTSKVINPNAPTSNVAADADSSLSYLVSGTQKGGGRSLSFDGSITPLPTATDVTTALATTHALDEVNGSYVTPKAGDDYAGGTIPTLTFTLDRVYDDVDSIILWNYAHKNEFNQTKDFEVAFFSDREATNQVGSTFTGQLQLRPLSATIVAAEQFIFENTYSGVQAFTITLKSNWNGNRIGLSEARITWIPEAQALSLIGGFCALGFVLMRRHSPK